MKLNRRLARILSIPLVVVLMLQVTSCGTLLHPERRGQPKGERLDSSVVVLDAVGLLFFIIPGAIAFGVDFYNRTIYLPADEGGSFRAPSDAGDMAVVRVDRGELDLRTIERVVRQQTGLSVRLDQPDVRVVELKSAKRIPAEYAKAVRSGLLRD